MKENNVFRLFTIHVTVPAISSKQKVINKVIKYSQILKPKMSTSDIKTTKKKINVEKFPTYVFLLPRV